MPTTVSCSARLSRSGSALSSGLLSVSSESSQRPLRLRRWSRQRRVASTALAACLARAGANLHIHVLKHARLSRALGGAAAAPPTARGLASMPAIHGLTRSEERRSCFVFSARGMRAKRGPSDTASGRRRGPQGGPQTKSAGIADLNAAGGPKGEPQGCGESCGPVRRRCTDAPSANPGVRQRTRSPWMGEGRVRGVAFLLVTSLWPRKEKSHACPD